MKRTVMWCGALALSWFALGGEADAQYCRGNVDCGAGWVCNQGTCVQGASVQVGVQAGPAQGTGTVTVTGAQPQPVPPPPQQPPPQQPPPPQYAPQYAPQPAPATRYEERPIWGLIGPGIGLLAGGYVLNILVTGIGAAVIAAEDSIDGSSSTLADEFFYTGLIPAAGPWVQLAIMLADGREDWGPWLVLDGILQTAGLTMIILGAAITQRVAVRADLGDDVELAVSPSLGGMNASLTW